MSDYGVINRLIARIRALLPRDWQGSAGQRFRKSVDAVSKFAEENHVTPKELAEEAVSLGRRKLEGLANRDYASAMKDFAEAEQRTIDVQLQRRSLESKVRKQQAEAEQAEATARLERAKALEAELKLFKELKASGVLLHRDQHGNLSVLPCPENCDLDHLAQRRLQEESIDPFLMAIEDIFLISGRGTVVTGRIERGRIKAGEEVEIVGFRETRKTVVTSVEMFRKQVNEGLAGDSVGLLLRDTGKDDLERGMVLVTPGSITPHTKFKAQVYIFTKEEGGRHTPFFKGYRPQFFFRTMDVTGVVEVPVDTVMVLPGENVSLRIELVTPVALEKGLRFDIREGGRTLGSGMISEIIE